MVNRRHYDIYLRDAKGKTHGFMVFRHDASVDPARVAEMIARERIYPHFVFHTMLVVSGGFEATFDRSQVGPSGSV